MWQSRSLRGSLRSMVKHLLVRLLLITALAVPAFCLTGCQGVLGQVAAVAMKVLPIITEAAAILDAIDLQAKAHFKANPNRELEEQYVVAAAKARLSLSAASRALKGTEHLDGADVEAAFDEYEKAFQEVMALLGPLGVVRPTADGALLVSADGALLVPMPLALSYSRGE